MSNEREPTTHYGLGHPDRLAHSHIESRHGVIGTTDPQAEVIDEKTKAKEATAPKPKKTKAK